jgi:predicted protein tyrosine phosphatase
VNKKKILCVCQRGNCRSAGMAFILKDYFNLDALACGIEAVQESTWQMLYSWADIVILMHDELLEQIPQDTREKIILCNVGEDVYWRGIDKMLFSKCNDFIIEHKNLLGVN